MCIRRNIVELFISMTLNGMVDMDIKSKRTEFFNGARDTLPLVIGAIPFGIIFGTLSGGAGTTGRVEGRSVASTS